MLKMAVFQLVMERVRRSSVKAGGGGRNDLALIDDSEVVELQNGCACCSASDELLTVRTHFASSISSSQHAARIPDWSRRTKQGTPNRHG